MAQRRTYLLMLPPAALLAVIACSDSGGELPFWVNDGPLAVRPAQEALCSGGGDRETDGGSGGRGQDEHGSYDALSDASSAYGGSGGASWGGSSGSGGALPSDAGADAALDAECDEDAETGACGEDAGEDSDATPDENPEAGAAPAMKLTSAQTTVCDGVDLSTPLKLYLSADDSNSMASPAIIRSLVRNGAQSVDPWRVRTYEFLNYYRFDFAPARPGELSIVSQIGSCVLSGDLALQIAIQSEQLPERRPGMNIVLVLDTSGSMGGMPIALAQAAVIALAEALQAGDVISAVTWNTSQNTILEGYVVQSSKDPVLLTMAASLNADGGTDLHSGLLSGYALAEKYRTPGRMTRVVLISDGQANVGVTDEALIGSKADDQDAEGIYMVGVGVGEGVNDTLMDVVTDAGRGAYIYLDSEAEARRMFVDRFGESMMVAARDVKVELTLPAYFNMKKFYGEEYSPDPTKVRPQHLAPNDSMVFYQILEPCHPDLPRASDPYRVRVTWNDPINGAAKEAVQATTLGALDFDDGNLTKAAAVVTYAEALKSLQTLPPSERADLLGKTIDIIRNANGNKQDPDLIEIEGILDKLIDNQSGY